MAIQTEPRWPAIMAVLASGGLYAALPEDLTVGPSWLVLVVVIALLIPTVVTRRSGRHRANQALGYALAMTVTVALVLSLVLLIQALPSRKETPKELLTSAAALWLANILVFASWYWRLDAGGPRQRELRTEHKSGAFLFPQMTLRPDQVREEHYTWRPGFVDYLFLAFNTSTAFSPTDVPVLSRWAKLLMMMQALISFTTVAILAARAINIL